MGSSLEQDSHGSAELSSLIACRDCDMLNRRTAVSRGGKARCARCGNLLYRDTRDGLRRAFMLQLAALILFVIANTHPLFFFELQGRLEANTLLSGVLTLYDQGMPGLAVLILFVTILAPLVQTAFMVCVLGTIHCGCSSQRLARMFALVVRLQRWSMLEIYLLGALVSLVQLTDLASIELGIAFFSLVALIVVTILSWSVLEPEEVWERLPVRG